MTVLKSQWHEAPDLPGDRVKLVQLHERHAPGVLTAADDDEVFQWMSLKRPHTLAAAKAIVTGYLDNPNLVAWAQIDQHSNELAGLTTFYDINPESRSVAIGHTWLGKKHWRTAINTESKLLLLSRAFDDLGAVRVVWHTDNLNERSQAAIERLGARREGVLRKHRQRLDGSWRDTVAYSMLDDEWPAAKKNLEERLA
ncbi:MAG: GNAT family N-acetyltransferase [Kineosporiaceae bacterium]|nr:GNAT family N-acetyltransferase [Aeromicrobium sp.]